MSHYSGSVPDTPRATHWRDEAACRFEDPDVFFAEGNASRAEVIHAQSVCHTCPVRIECGEYALQAGEYYGVWGGMSQNQLRQQRRRFGHSSEAKTVKPAPRKREPAKCGTRSGYARHLREKTEICGPCRQANTDADNRLRRTGTTKAAA